MSLSRGIFILGIILTSVTSQAQKDSVWQTLTRPTTELIKKTETTITKFTTRSDSIIQTVQDVPLKYIKQVDQKIDKYSNRITSKTEKTLESSEKMQKMKGSFISIEDFYSYTGLKIEHI